MKTIQFVIVAAVLFACSVNSKIQTHSRSIVLRKGEVFKLNDAQLVIDTLIMNDGSQLVLNKRFEKVSIQVMYFSYGKDCMIQGEGKRGAGGTDGVKGATLGSRYNSSFATAGDRSRTTVAARPGSAGGSGVNLSLQCNTVAPQGKLTINLRGGNGGEGGDSGGINSQSGVGGNGGDISLSFPQKFETTVSETVIIQNEGGYSGLLKGERAQGRKGKLEIVFLKN